MPHTPVAPVMPGAAVPDPPCAPRAPGTLGHHAPHTCEAWRILRAPPHSPTLIGSPPRALIFALLWSCGALRYGKVSALCTEDYCGVDPSMCWCHDPPPMGEQKRWANTAVCCLLCIKADAKTAVAACTPPPTTACNRQGHPPTTARYTPKAPALQPPQQGQALPSGETRHAPPPPRPPPVHARLTDTGTAVSPSHQRLGGVGGSSTVWGAVRPDNRGRAQSCR